jgi:hypothetical protein
LNVDLFTTAGASVQIVIVLLGIISDNPWEGLGWAMVGTLLGETLNFL